MIKLVQFYPMFGVMNMSPPCMKVECFLRMTKLPHEVVSKSDPRISPSGRFPYVEIEGVKYTDSSRIVDVITEKYDVTVDDHLTEKEKGMGVALQRLLDDHLYWIAAYSRWNDERNWPIMRDTLFGSLPPLRKWFISNLVRRDFIKRVKGQGLGLQGDENIYALGMKDVEAISGMLGDNEFIFGDKPSTYDATLYSYLANLFIEDFEFSVKDFALKDQNLVSYTKRMDTFFAA